MKPSAVFVLRLIPKLQLITIQECLHFTRTFAGPHESPGIIFCVLSHPILYCYSSIFSIITFIIYCLASVMPYPIKPTIYPFGGLGLHEASHVSPAAFLGYCIGLQNLCTQLLASFSPVTLMTSPHADNMCKVAWGGYKWVAESCIIGLTSTVNPTITMDLRLLKSLKNSYASCLYSI